MISRLCCPVCDSTYLHQIAVFAGFRREEDEPESLTVAVDKTGVRTSLGRLADRRDEALIYFVCEQCTPNDRWNVPNPEFALRIYQHKGETLLEWGNKRPVELDPT